MIWSTPILIDKYLVKNRIIFPPISGNWATPDGFVTNKTLNFYSDIAQGGCGMVVISGTSISQEGRGSDRSLSLYDIKQLKGFERLSAIIRENGCFASIQLMHVGGQGNPSFTGCNPVAPSRMMYGVTGCISNELSFGEIDDICSQFITSALLAYRAGFQAVELHLGHGYLLHEFLSEHTNKRQDDYGGSVLNRMRLVLKIIEGIHKKTPDLLIGVRISGEDFIPDGINSEANLEYLPVLEEAGVKYFSVTAGTYKTSKLKHEAMAHGDFFTYAKTTKSIVSKPVIGVGKILDLESAEKHLSNNNCDMVAIGRGLISDPFMIEKAKSGKPFKRCIECDFCQYLRFGRSEMSCPQWETSYD